MLGEGVFSSRAAAKLPQTKKSQALGSGQSLLRAPCPYHQFGKGKSCVCTTLTEVSTQHTTALLVSPTVECRRKPRRSLSLTSNHAPALSLGSADPRQAGLADHFQPILHWASSPSGPQSMPALVTWWSRGITRQPKAGLAQEIDTENLMGGVWKDERKKVGTENHHVGLERWLSG